MAEKEEGAYLPITTVSIHAVALVVMFLTGGIFGSVYQQHAEARAMRVYEDRRQPWGGIPVKSVCSVNAPWGPISVFREPACLATQPEDFLRKLRADALSLLADEEVRNRGELENVLRAIEQELARRNRKEAAI